MRARKPIAAPPVGVRCFPAPRTPHLCTFAPLHLCTFAPLHLCTFAPLHLCTFAPLHLCTFAPLHLCTFAPLHLCTFAPLHLCTLNPHTAPCPLHLCTLNPCTAPCFLHLDGVRCFPCTAPLTRAPRPACCTVMGGYLMISNRVATSSPLLFQYFAETFSPSL